MPPAELFCCMLGWHLCLPNVARFKEVELVLEALLEKAIGLMKHDCVTVLVAKVAA